MSEQALNSMLQTAGIKPNTAYRVGQVAAILGVSSTTIRNMCDAWEPENVNTVHAGLECYVFGTKRERRIPHHAVVAWLHKQHGYNAVK